MYIVVWTCPHFDVIVLFDQLRIVGRVQTSEPNKTKLMGFQKRTTKYERSCKSLAFCPKSLCYFTNIQYMHM